MFEHASQSLGSSFALFHLLLLHFTVVGYMISLWMVVGIHYAQRWILLLMPCSVILESRQPTDVSAALPLVPRRAQRRSVPCGTSTYIARSMRLLGLLRSHKSALHLCSLPICLCCSVTLLCLLTLANPAGHTHTHTHTHTSTSKHEQPSLAPLSAFMNNDFAHRMLSQKFVQVLSLSVAWRSVMCQLMAGFAHPTIPFWAQLPFYWGAYHPSTLSL